MFAIPSPAEIGFEEGLRILVLWIEVFVDLVGSLLIAAGVAAAVVGIGYQLLRPTERGYERTRLVLARFLSLGLEFQLAADILATTISPTWPQIGQLAAIAAIRTALNYFLAREMKEEQEAVRGATGEGELRTAPTIS